MRGLRGAALGAGCVALLALPVHAQKVHEIRAVGEAGGEEYRFVPATVTARPGDVLVFRVASGPPHSVVFDSERLSPRAREALNRAFERRAGDLTSPALTRTGEVYRLVLPPLPPGRYPFYCLPHRAYDMRGEVIVR